MTRNGGCVRIGSGFGPFTENRHVGNAEMGLSRLHPLFGEGIDPPFAVLAVEESDKKTLHIRMFELTQVALLDDSIDVS